ncbi:MAG: D-alanine--D-alanine ligase [Cyanobacteria bacterium J06621_8]
MTFLKELAQSRYSSQSANLAVLHLVGSAVSEFYYQLSVLYAKEVVQPVGVSSYYAVVSPEGLWQLGADLDSLSDKISLAAMVERLPAVDVVVPHMFCFPGMTSYRSFFEELLGIPVVGNRADINSLATNKSHTRNIVAAAGVKVAAAQLLQRSDTLAMKPPFVVKPNSEDNSIGLTLVKTEAEIAAALEAGFKYDETLLVEEYIPGREMRVGVVEINGILTVLPALEYLLTKDNPIRSLDDKLTTKNDGELIRQAVNIDCPAVMNPELEQKLAQAVTKAHLALGCRDYSLYDFRIHAETQEPYMLESCSFWSFIDASVLSRMIAADGRKLEEVAYKIWSNAAQRSRVACGSLFKYVNPENN